MTYKVKHLGPVHTDAYSSNTKQNLSVFTPRPHGYAENDGIVFKATSHSTISDIPMRPLCED